MSLLKTVSGLRGTIGGMPNHALTPVDIIEAIVAFARLLKKEYPYPTVVIGRDGRKTGHAIQQVVVGTLNLCGINVVDIGCTTTPTLAYTTMQHPTYKGGIIISASHNPEHWNALKILNQDGEFFTANQISTLFNTVTIMENDFVATEQLGAYQLQHDAIAAHVYATVNYPLVQLEKIRKRKFKIVADVINSTGAIALKALFESMEVEFILLNDKNEGQFAHNPEPLPENLKSLADAVIQHAADMGIAVDPDVDRVCFVDEHGDFFGEEYTIVAIADYFLAHRKGALVSNLSSSQALQDLAMQNDVPYYASKVGEAYVVEKMKEKKAVFGGEGNGGVIVPDFHYGRDAIIGIALFLSHVANENMSVSRLRKKYPHYIMIKDKLDISTLSKTKHELIQSIKIAHADHNINDEDGLKIWIDTHTWVQIRFSNTEPIVRIIAESTSEATCKQYIERIKALIKA